MQPPVLAERHRHHDESGEQSLLKSRLGKLRDRHGKLRHRCGAEVIIGPRRLQRQPQTSAIAGDSRHQEQLYSGTRRRRSALPTTDTELKHMASAAIIGDSVRPNHGYSTPAASGTPIAL